MVAFGKAPLASPEKSRETAESRLVDDKDPTPHMRVQVSPNFYKSTHVLATVGQCPHALKQDSQAAGCISNSFVRKVDAPWLLRDVSDLYLSTTNPNAFFRPSTKNAYFRRRWKTETVVVGAFEGVKSISTSSIENRCALDQTGSHNSRRQNNQKL